jgi:hypothetical protein
VSIQKKLKALFAEVVREAEDNPQFAERLGQILGDAPKPSGPPGRTHRRTPAVLDPFEEYKKGEAVLRERLMALDLDLLRDVVAQYGMDRSKLAMKWKDKERLVDLIVSTVTSRSEKGHAFRTPGMSSPEEHATVTNHQSRDPAQ